MGVNVDIFDDLIKYFRILGVIFIGSQLFCFFIDFIAWAVRKKHPAKIEKSENVSYPKFLTVHIWHDSHRAHRYKQITFIRKGDNKYKEYINLSVGGWIGNILIYLLCLAVIFAVPVMVLILAPNDPHFEYFGWSFIVFFIFVHRYLAGPDTLARIELKKYLKAQDR
jgi:hypothetical protein